MAHIHGTEVKMSTDGSFSKNLFNQLIQKTRTNDGNGRKVSTVEQRQRDMKRTEAREFKIAKKLKLVEEFKNSKAEKRSEAKPGRDWTLSIALPSSILEYAQTEELRVYLVAQIARAAAIYNVDEIVIFDETGSIIRDKEGNIANNWKNHPHNFTIQFASLLQYMDCPQYLRAKLFPMHPMFRHTGLLPPLDAFHQFRAHEWSEYREGLVTDTPGIDDETSWANIGLKQDCLLDKSLKPGARVTVKLQVTSGNVLTKLRGTLVAPSEPRTLHGRYWGYRTRLVLSLSDVFADCPLSAGGKYDVVIGTSERGTDVDEYSMPPRFKHALVVFGGVKGLETAVEADPHIKTSDPSEMFNTYLNTCPKQGSRTIRTEEAILVTLSALRPKISAAQRSSKS